MTRPATVRAYGALLVLYPRSFRREYGEDMALLFEEQLRDENPWRVCTRAATDLALTIPTNHLEAVMKASTSPFLSTLFGAVAVAGIVSAIVSGTNAILALSGVAVGVAAGGLAAASYRRNRPLAPSGQTGGWWKLLAAGGGLLTALIITLNVTGEVPDGFWFPMIITGLTAVVLMVMGLIGGASRLSGTARHRDAF